MTTMEKDLMAWMPAVVAVFGEFAVSIGTAYFLCPFELEQPPIRVRSVIVQQLTLQMSHMLFPMSNKLFLPGGFNGAKNTLI